MEKNPACFHQKP